MKKVLVIGGSGFIGNALCRRLKSAAFHVTSCDIRKDDELTFDDFIFADDFNQNANSIFERGFTLCVNCAGSASVPYSFQNPFQDYELNTRTVFTILDGIRKSGSGVRFINLSSAAVYGNPSSLPISEKMPLHPISPYGNHKLMSEMIVNQFRDYFGIDGTSLRIFSAYGPGLKKQILWDLYEKASIGNEILMHGTGNETRDFIYIDDLITAIMLVALNPERLLPAYNIANEEEIKINKVVSLFCAAYNSSLSYHFNGKVREGDPLYWRADITSLQNLGYRPEISIEEGITRYVNWLPKK